MNSTCESNTIPTYTNLTVAVLTFFVNLVLLLLKKEGLLDRLFPKAVPRKETLRRLHDVDNRLGNITIQLTNLTPQNSDSNSDERLHSSSGVRSDRDSDRDEDVQRLRVCEEGCASVNIQLSPAAVLEKSSGIRDSGAERAEPRRWQRQTELVRAAHSGRDQTASGASSRASASSGSDKPSQRKALRTPITSDGVSPSQSQPASSAQEGLQATHRL